MVAAMSINTAHSPTSRQEAASGSSRTHPHDVCLLCLNLGSCLQWDLCGSMSAHSKMLQLVNDSHKLLTVNTRHA
jgi:hypothetical protein